MSMVTWNPGSGRSSAKRLKETVQIVLLWWCLHGSRQLPKALNSPLKIGEFYYL